jgi:formylglycine-generating enzyme required for sulfatase activity
MASLIPAELAHRYPPVLPPEFASAYGDDEYGLWADFYWDPADEESVKQRFRWIEPGEFLMGSPEEEKGRDDDEGPQHRVVLTEGLWLADTACTQELWQLVMGQNPSRFKDPLRPVEQVSWNDIQGFLKKFMEKVGGVRAGLPTEAEWEYACRADTTTPFHLGEQITLEQVNYNGDYPYAGGKKGLNRRETVDAKHFAPNRWGLYQMHGNVWQWCRDGKRKYVETGAKNPLGPEGPAASRVLRGGSWSWGARRCRSAFRYSAPPSDRVWFGGEVGFRFSLRSMGQRAEPLPRGARSGGGTPPRRPEGGAKR